MDIEKIAQKILTIGLIISFLAFFLGFILTILSVHRIAHILYLLATITLILTPQVMIFAITVAFIINREYHNAVIALVILCIVIGTVFLTLFIANF